MNGKCIDIGTIQAFLDGETTAETSLKVSEHIANCAQCTNLLAVAEDENSFVFSTLEREMNTLVPTQRLWSRINESIEVEKANEPIWTQIYASVSAAFRSPSFTAAAGLLLIVGIVAVMWTMRSGSPMDNATSVAFIQDINQGLNTGDSKPVAAPLSADAVVPNAPSRGAIQIKAGNRSNEELEKLVREVGRRNEIRPITLEHTPLPGEHGYIKTISDLKEAYDGRRDAVFTGSSRVAFERDLAVVNDGIKRMQKVVRKNPNNQAARQVLYSAYQDKIDLLNTVAQRDELMASIR